MAQMNNHEVCHYIAFPPSTGFNKIRLLCSSSKSSSRGQKNEQSLSKIELSIRIHPIKTAHVCQYLSWEPHRIPANICVQCHA